MSELTDRLIEVAFTDLGQMYGWDVWAAYFDPATGLYYTATGFGCSCSWFDVEHDLDEVPVRTRDELVSSLTRWAGDEAHEPDVREAVATIRAWKKPKEGEA